MDQWVERVTDYVSVVPGVLVQANPDRVALYINNLSASTLHITPGVPSQGSTGGQGLKQDVPFSLQWALDGNLARCEWWVTDATGVEHVHIVESLYYGTSEVDNVPSA